MKASILCLAAVAYLPAATIQVEPVVISGHIFTQSLAMPGYPPMGSIEGHFSGEDRNGVGFAIDYTDDPRASLLFFDNNNWDDRAYVPNLQYGDYALDPGTLRFELQARLVTVRVVDSEQTLRIPLVTHFKGVEVVSDYRNYDDYSYSATYTFATHAPEPAPAFLVGFAAAGLVAWRRFSRRATSSGSGPLRS